MRARLALEDATITELPVLVRPRPDELLHGLLLRVDRANGFPAGSTAATVARYPASASALGRASLSVSGRVYDLAALAALLGWEESQVVSTTLDTELSRIYGPDYHARVLGAAKEPFRVCASCAADGGLIRRETVLPNVEMCRVHRVRLVRACSCGRRLHPNSGGEEPFTCPACWMPWASLPADPLDPKDDLRQRRLHHAYAVLLERADESLPTRVAELAAMDGPPRWSDGWSSPGSTGSAQFAVHHEAHSLGACVTALLIREIPPERVFEARPSHPRERLECANLACPGRGGPGTMRLNGLRPNGAETYCAECGSRYIGDRMIVSYDAGNGTVGAAAVASARARLAGYHERLAAACDELEGRRNVHIGDVFRQAGVPNARHLRARRLGLVSLVRSRMDPSLRLDADAGLPDPSPRWSTPTGKVRRPIRIAPGPRRT